MRSILISLNNLFIGKLIHSFTRIKLTSQIQSNKAEKGMNILNKFVNTKTSSQLKSVFSFWNFQNTNVGNK